MVQLCGANDKARLLKTNVGIPIYAILRTVRFVSRHHAANLRVH